MTERGHGPRGFARGRPGGAGIAGRSMLRPRRRSRGSSRRAVPRREGEDAERAAGGTDERDGGGISARL